jgi:peptide/nickel transport system substrate-binding protein/oligopeptide transport system substrate-binding protein
MRKALIAVIVVALVIAGVRMTNRDNQARDTRGTPTADQALLPSSDRAETTPGPVPVSEEPSEESPAAGSSTLSEPAYGGTLRWREAENPSGLDPHMATDAVSARVSYCLFENLVANSVDGKSIVPLLAESWSSSEDGLTWTFKLREGVRFHKAAEGGKPTENGGREVTARDWKWSLERLVRDKSPRAYFIDCVEGYLELADGKSEEWSGIKAVGDYTIEFRLKKPFASFISVLAYNTFVVLPREDVEKWGGDFGLHPVGTGPFTFEEWKRDQSVTLSRNPDYWRSDENGGKLPYLGAWEMVIIPDSAAAWEEFKKGNLDMMRGVPERLVKECREFLGDSFLEGSRQGVYNNLAAQRWVRGAALPALGDYAAPMDTVWLDKK